MKLSVGHGRRCITPPLGIGMVGYASRTDGAAGVHDDLFVNAVALGDGETTAALIALDLCLLSTDLAAEFKQAITEATGLPAERVFLNTSHTHAGPTVGRYGEPTEQVLAYRADVLERTTAAAREALDDRGPAEFRVGSAPLDIGCNRRETLPDGKVILGHDPNGPAIREVTVWTFARDDCPDVVLFSTPMHGTTLGGQNLIISAEWMGMAVQYLEEETPGVRAVFLQGCGADQDPYYSREGGGRGTFPELEDHGRRAAEAARDAVRDARPLEPLPMAVALRRVELPPKEEEGEARTLVLHGLRLGDAVLLSLSAEAFVEYAEYGAAVSPACETLVLGYTDGNIGYLCTADAYPEGGYEIKTTRVAPDSERIVKDVMREMLAELTA